MNVLVERLSSSLAAVRRYTELPRGVEAVGRLLRRDDELEPAIAALVGAFEPSMMSPADFGQVHYSAVIINLGGIVERYIEDLINLLVMHLGYTADTWGDLPEQLRNHNTATSVDLISALRDKRREFETVSLEAVVANLSVCLDESARFELTPEAFSYHTANYWHEVVVQAFSRIGVESAGLEHDCADRCAGLDIPPEWQSPILNELMARRNHVAHGRAVNLLSVELLQVLIDGTEKYLMCLTDRAVDFVVRNAVRLDQLAALGRPDELFRQGRIVGFYDLRHALVRGDAIAAVPGSGLASLVSVDSLEIDHVRVEEAAEGSSVGIGVTASVSSRNRLWLVPRAFAEKTVAF